MYWDTVRLQTVRISTESGKRDPTSVENLELPRHRFRLRDNDSKKRLYEENRLRDEPKTFA